MFETLESEKKTHSEWKHSGDWIWRSTGKLSLVLSATAFAETTMKGDLAVFESKMGIRLEAKAAAELAESFEQVLSLELWTRSVEERWRQRKAFVTVELNRCCVDATVDRDDIRNWIVKTYTEGTPGGRLTTPAHVCNYITEQRPDCLRCGYELGEFGATCQRLDEYELRNPKDKQIWFRWESARESIPW